MHEKQIAFPAWRSHLVAAMCALAFVVLVVGAIWRVAYQGDFLQNESDKRYKDKITVNGERGVIWDRNGRPLAISSDVYSAYVDPTRFRRWAEQKSADEVEDKISRMSVALGVSGQRLGGKLALDNYFAYVGHRYSPEAMQGAKAMGFPQLHFEKRYVRFYPSAQESAHVIGFVDRQGRGMAGIEALKDGHMAPLAGVSEVRRTAKGNVLDRRVIRPVVDGGQLYTTIDSRLQYFASVALGRALERHEAKFGALVIMDVSSGDILAMTGVPTYNPNKIGDDIAARRNRALQDMYEPGSTIKPIIAAIAIEEGKIEPGTVLNTSEPAYFGRKYKVVDEKNDEDVTVAEALMRSLNLGAVRMSESLEDETMWAGLHAFGYGQPVGLGLRGEAPGRLFDHADWRPVEKANMSFGYRIKANLVQVARAYAALGNDGMMPAPGLLMNEQRPAQTRAVSAATASQVMAMLENVVSDGGTGRLATIPLYRVAGKTGTTNKYVEGVGYDEKAHYAWFVGLVPASAPRFVCAVLVGEPKVNGTQGGSAAAPVFAEVMGHALRMYAIPHDDTVVDDFTVASADDAGAGNG